MPESWSARRGADPLEQRLDRLMSAGRQLVDGVSGARPGSRSAGRLEGRLEGRLPRLEGLGRWVETKLDWILEDEDDWREPWQQPRSVVPAAPAAARPSRRRPLEAISRRSAAPLRSSPLIDEAAAADWPDDDSFTVPRWQRQGMTGSQRASVPQQDAAPSQRPSRGLPRSSRRRNAG